MDRIEVMYRLSALFGRDAEEENTWVAWCPALGIVSQGESETEAKETLQSAVTLYIKRCYTRNIFDREMKKRGARPVSPGESLGGADGKSDFVAVRDTVKDAQPFDIPVSIDLLVAEQLAATSSKMRAASNQ
jgi:predicted RNase H-like HicB family nuclease